MGKAVRQRRGVVRPKETAPASRAEATPAGGAHTGGTPVPHPESVADAAERQRVVAALQKRQAGKTLSAGEIAAIRRFEERRALEQQDAALRAVSQKTLCELLDTDRKVIGDWERDGMPARSSGRARLYDLHLVLPWLKKRWMLGEDVAGLPSKRQAEIRVLIAREATLKAKMALMSGQYMPVEDVKKREMGHANAVRAGLEAVKRQLAPSFLELGTDPTLEEVEALIDANVDSILRVFAGEE